MTNLNLDDWPHERGQSAFPVYQTRKMATFGIWEDDNWAIKSYGIQAHERTNDEPLISDELVQSAKKHVLSLLPLTKEEGEFYKTGFAVLHQGVLANWLLFQWWTHGDVWCQFLSYAPVDDPQNFKISNRPVRACVYETAIIWHEQKAWVKNVLNGNPSRRAYLDDRMQSLKILE